VILLQLRLLLQSAIPTFPKSRLLAGVELARQPGLVVLRAGPRAVAVCGAVLDIQTARRAAVLLARRAINAVVRAGTEAWVAVTLVRRELQVLVVRLRILATKGAGGFLGSWLALVA